MKWAAFSEAVFFLLFISYEANKIIGFVFLQNTHNCTWM